MLIYWKRSQKERKKEADKEIKSTKRNTLKMKREREDASPGPDSSEASQRLASEASPVIKSQPNFVFATWLVKNLGQSYMRHGTGVIDIAGGNGLLSFELTCRYGIPSTVLDPREMKFNAILRRRMKKLTKNRRKILQQKKIELSSAGQEGHPTSTKKWENAVIKVEDDCLVIDRVLEAIAETVSTPFQQYQIYYEGTHSPITASRELDKELLSNASLFVGMHPGKHKLKNNFLFCNTHLLLF